MAAALISFKGIFELITLLKDGGPLAVRRTCKGVLGLANSKSSAIISIDLSVTSVSTIVPGTANMSLKVQWLQLKHETAIHNFLVF